MELFILVTTKSQNNTPCFGSCLSIWALRDSYETSREAEEYFVKGKIYDYF
jgi:hypothetical protein